MKDPKRVGGVLLFWPMSYKKQVKTQNLWNVGESGNII